jgi:hypothetical protein
VNPAVILTANGRESARIFKTDFPDNQNSGEKFQDSRRFAAQKMSKPENSLNEGQFPRNHKIWALFGKTPKNVEKRA